MKTFRVRPHVAAIAVLACCGAVIVGTSSGGIEAVPAQAAAALPPSSAAASGLAGSDGIADASPERRVQAGRDAAAIGRTNDP